MQLGQLIDEMASCSEKDASVLISDLTLHSQHLLPGEIFLAIKGNNFDGRQYISEAIHKGASAVLCEAEGYVAFDYQNTSCPIIPIYHLRDKLSTLAKRFYGNQSADMKVIGVTGTNGKTTTTFLLAQSLSQLQQPTAVLGTLGYGFIDQLSSTALTTPDLFSLQKQFKLLKQKGASQIAMEVSSHALDQGRVSDVHFKSAIFTNLTQDHLDYHGNMTTYGQAKAKLFRFASLERGVINADSDYCEQILKVIHPALPIALVTTSPQPYASSHSFTTHVFVKNYELKSQGMSVEVSTSWGDGILHTTLMGNFNISNLLCALAELCMQGISIDKALHALNHVKPPPGRMQIMGGNTFPTIIIDYSHTPDALQNALTAARLHCQGRLWCVFGCGGDRDKTKRSQMGKIAAHYADQVVITNDNPRTENPSSIIQDIIQELTQPVTIEPDREQAIAYAIQHAAVEDIILVAGKGHEDYQIIGDQKLPFSDSECVNRYLHKGKK